MGTVNLGAIRWIGIITVVMALLIACEVAISGI